MKEERTRAESIELNDGVLYRNMIEQTRDIILVVDTLGNILSANQAAVTAYGYSIGELRCMRVHDLRSSETRAAVDAQLKIAQQEGTLFRTAHLRRTGEPFPVEVSSRCIRFSDKEAVISIIRDITDTIAMETAIRENVKKYRLLNKELSVAYEELMTSEEELRQQLDELLVREETIRRQNIVLASLHETALQLMQKPEINDVLRLIVSNATELLGTTHGYISLVDEEKGRFRRKIGLGYYNQDVGRDIKLTDGLVGRVYKSGEIVIVDDYCAWENRLSEPFFDQLHSVAQVPLKEGDKVIGTFGVAFLTAERKFTEQEISFLSRFAEIASIALINAQLLNSLVESKKELQKNNEVITAAHEELLASEEELKQQFDELLTKEEKIERQNIVISSVHETALALLHRLDLDEVLKTIIFSAVQLLGITDGYINLVDEKEKIFVRSVALGRFAQDMARQTTITEGLLGQSYVTGKIAILDDYSTWEDRLSDSVFSGLHCCVVVPLKIGDRVIGALGLAFAEPGRIIADHEISLLQKFADLASIALDNANLVTSYKNELLERRRAEEIIKTSEAKYRAIFEAANDGIYIHDIYTGEILDINQRACEMYGYTREEILAGNLSVIGTGATPYSVIEARELIMRAVAGESQLFEWQNKHKDGHLVWVEINLKRALIGKEDRILAIVRDISERKVQEQAIWRMAYYDSLTGLPNRRCLQERLAQELEKARRGEASGAVLFVDMDDLKMINDTLGHSFGDDVIIRAGAYLFAEAGENAVVARIGGDEFIVLFPNEGNRERIARIADNVIKLLGCDYGSGETVIHMSASIGIALYPLDGDAAEEIFKNADLALYAAKGSGKNTWRFYEPNLQIIANENMILKSGLRKAIERNELSLHYQPLVNAKSGNIVSFEALLRWTSSTCGSVPPGRFIPLAEESDTINIIGKWVIEETCRFARKLTELGKGDIRVSVNVSPRQLMADNFVAIVRDAISSAGIKPPQLEIEITENALIVSLEDSINKLGELRAIGVRLSLDDFGTGYSSLTYLRSLPVGMLKIDKSFIDQIVVDKAQLQFVCSIVNMAHSLGLTVVAEGVECEEQLIKLVECNCDFIQGYFISRPISENEAMFF